jgi:hypothetical protein
MADEKNQCVSCGADSEGRLLISCEQKGQPVWVCARCLPMFIHGGN